MGSIHEKTRGQKSRAPIPLTYNLHPHREKSTLIGTMVGKVYFSVTSISKTQLSPLPLMEKTYFSVFCNGKCLLSHYPTSKISGYQSHPINEQGKVHQIPFKHSSSSFALFLSYGQNICFPKNFFVANLPYKWKKIEWKQLKEVLWVIGTKFTSGQ